MSKFKTANEIYGEVDKAENSRALTRTEIKNINNKEYISKEDLHLWLHKRFSASSVTDLMKELERD
jgi:hypothetical protein